MRVLLQPLGVEIIDVIELETEIRVDEIGKTYAENASLKAGVFAGHFQIWTIGDDTGLEVDALEGAPGLRSARLAGPSGSDTDRRKILLSLLRSHPRPWTARFRCVVALAGPEGGIDLAEGMCEGEIIPDERGDGGFGYDPHHSIVRANREGLAAVLTKPFKVRKLIAECRAALTPTE